MSFRSLAGHKVMPVNEYIDLLKLLNNPRSLGHGRVTKRLHVEQTKLVLLSQQIIESQAAHVTPSACKAAIFRRLALRIQASASAIRRSNGFGLTRLGSTLRSFTKSLMRE